MQQYGIFNDESADWTELEAVEAGFWSIDEAELAIKRDYQEEDDLTIHAIEETDDEEDGDEVVEDESEEDCE
jgi:hypothetical protein